MVSIQNTFKYLNYYNFPNILYYFSGKEIDTWCSADSDIRDTIKGY